MLKSLQVRETAQIESTLWVGNNHRERSCGHRQIILVNRDKESIPSLLQC